MGSIPSGLGTGPGFDREDIGVGSGWFRWEWRSVQGSLLRLLLRLLRRVHEGCRYDREDVGARSRRGTVGTRTELGGLRTGVETGRTVTRPPWGCSDEGLEETVGEESDCELWKEKDPEG